MIIGLKLRSFISPLNVGKVSLLVVFTMIIITTIVQKMAKILVLLEAGRSLPYYGKLKLMKLSLRQTPLRPASSVRLIESQIKGVKKGRALISATLISRVAIRQQR